MSGAKPFISTTLISVIGRVGGMILPFLIAFLYGANAETDAFFLSYALIFFVMVLINNIFETMMVPFVAEVGAGKKSIGAFVGRVQIKGSFYVAILVLGLLVCFSLFFQPRLLSLTSFDLKQFQLIFIFVLEMTPGLLLATWTSSMNGALSAQKHFHLPAFSPALRSFTILIFVVLFHSVMGIHAIPVGFLTGEILRFCGASLGFLRYVGRPNFTLPMQEETKSFFKSAKPQAIGLFFISFITIVDQTMASFTGERGVSLYHYADRLYLVPFMLMTAGMIPIIFSHWASDLNSKSNPLTWQSASKTIMKLSGVMLLVSAILFIARDYVVGGLFTHGAFPKDELGVVSLLFGILLTGLPFETINQLCVRLLMVYKLNHVYMIVGMVRVFLDIILNLLFMKYWGLFGIAISTSVLHLLASLFLGFYVRQVMLRASGGSHGTE